MPDDELPAVRRTAQRVAYENAWLTLTEDDVTFADGTTGIYGVVHKRDYAVVVAVDGDRVHLVEQFRYPVGMRRWELPQGAVPEANTTPEGIASTELAEETGLRAGHLQVIGFLHDAYGYSSQGFHVVVATDLTQGEPAREVEEQDMRSAWFGLAEVWAMVDDGQITDSATVAALALFERHSGRLGQSGMSTSTRPSGPAS